jgi:hypothetical protein
MPKDLAEVQRGSNVRKLFNMFYTYFSSTYNEMTKTVDMVRLGAAPKRELFRSFWWLIFLPALFSTLLRKREETTAGDIVKGVVGYGAHRPDTRVPMTPGLRIRIQDDAGRSIVSESFSRRRKGSRRDETRRSIQSVLLRAPYAPGTLTFEIVRI